MLIEPLGGANLRVLEQNYRYDLLSPEKLLEKYVGKIGEGAALERVEGPRRGARRRRALGRADADPARGRRDHLGASPAASRSPSCPQNLIAKPTLVWLLEAGAEKPKVEVAYLADGLGWKADYVLASTTKDTSGDLTGWVTLDNRSGAAYENAKLKLVAGDVHRVQRRRRSSTTCARRAA